MGTGLVGLAQGFQFYHVGSDLAEGVMFETLPNLVVIRLSSQLSKHELLESTPKKV